MPEWTVSVCDRLQGQVLDDLFGAFWGFWLLQNHSLEDTLIQSTDYALCAMPKALMDDPNLE